MHLCGALMLQISIMMLAMTLYVLSYRPCIAPGSVLEESEKYRSLGACCSWGMSVLKRIALVPLGLWWASLFVFSSKGL